MNFRKWCFPFLMVLGAVIPLQSVGQSQTSAPSATQAFAPARGGRAPAIISPEVAADRSVTFRLRAATAQDVVLVGVGARRPMTKDAQGVWTVTTEPLIPDIYTYQFSVDGGSFPDPVNPQSAGTTGAGTSSVLSVPGATWTTADVPHGAVAKHVYRSSIIGATETFYVYTPPDYDAHRKEPYPVLYVLHGLGDEAYSWIGNGGAANSLDNLLAEGKIKPMILVSPAGYGNSGGTRGAAAGFPNFTRALIQEIMPMVQKQYDASSNPNNNAVTGLSMGAAQSLLLLNHLDQFAWIGSFSPGFDMYAPTWGQLAAGGRHNPAPPQPGAVSTLRMRPLLAEGNLAQTFPRLDAKANSRIKLLYLVCGTADDHLELTRQFKTFLDGRGVKLTYVEVPDAAHTWPLWRAQLGQFAQTIFK